MSSKRHSGNVIFTASCDLDIGFTTSSQCMKPSRSGRHNHVQRTLRGRSERPSVPGSACEERFRRSHRSPTDTPGPNFLYLIKAAVGALTRAAAAASIRARVRPPSASPAESIGPPGQESASQQRGRPSDFVDHGSRVSERADHHLPRRSNRHALPLASCATRHVRAARPASLAAEAREPLSVRARIWLVLEGAAGSAGRTVSTSANLIVATASS